jgi:hypothetical protein
MNCDYDNDDTDDNDDDVFLRVLQSEASGMLLGHKGGRCVEMKTLPT